MIQAAPKPKPEQDEANYPAYNNFTRLVKIGETQYRGDMGI